MAQIVVEMSGDEAKLFRAFQKVQQQIRQQEQALAKSGQAGDQAGAKIASGAGKAERSLKTAGKAGQDAFGAGAVRQLAGYAAGFVSVGAAAANLTRMLQEQRELQRELAEGFRAGSATSGTLSQLAGGDQAKLDRLQAMARKTYAEGAFADRADANRLMFELESAGIATEANRAFFSKLAGVEPETTPVIQAVGKMQSAFGDEAGSAKDIVSKAFAAAGPVTGASPSAMLTANLRGMASAKQLGLSDEELAAAVSVLAQQSDSPEVAGTQVASLLRSLQKQGFVEQHAGKSLTEMLDVIREMGMDTPEQIEYFGRQEAARAFAGLDPKKLQERIDSIRNAEATAADDAIRINEKHNAIIRAERAMKNQKALAEEEAARMEIAANAIQDQEERMAVEGGANWFTRRLGGGGTWRAGMHRTVFGNEDYLRLRGIMSPEQALARTRQGQSLPAVAPDPAGPAAPGAAAPAQPELAGIAAEFREGMNYLRDAASALHAGPTRRHPLDDK